MYGHAEDAESGYKMTMYKGVLLFDIAEPSINGWANQLGWRGYYEEWKNADGESFWMEVNEDESAETPYNCSWDLLWRDDYGNDELIASGSFAQIDTAAKMIMAMHDRGRPPSDIIAFVAEAVFAGTTP